MYFLANAPGWIKLLGNTDRNRPPKILNTIKLPNPHSGTSAGRTEIANEYSFGTWTYPWRLSCKVLCQSFFPINEKLDRSNSEAQPPDMNTEIQPQTGANKRFEEIRKGRKIPVCKHPKNTGNVIPATALENNASDKYIRIDFSSDEVALCQILSLRTRHFSRASCTNSTAILSWFWFPDPWRCFASLTWPLIKTYLYN